MNQTFKNTFTLGKTDVFEEQLETMKIYLFHMHNLNPHSFLSLMCPPKYKVRIELQEIIYNHTTEFQGKNLRSLTLSSTFRHLPD